MIPASVIASQLRASANFPGGQTLGPLCQALAQGIVSWLPSVVIQGATTGVLGAGTVTGTLAFQGQVPLVLSALSGGLHGQNAQALARMITLGLNGSLTGSPYQGVSTGVGQGTDVSVVTGVAAPALATAIQAAHASICAGLGGSGSLLPAFYTSLAAGIAVIVQTGVTIPVAVVAPTGPLGPASGVGTSLSSLV